MIGLRSLMETGVIVSLVLLGDASAQVGSARAIRDYQATQNVPLEILSLLAGFVTFGVLVWVLHRLQVRREAKRRVGK